MQESAASGHRPGDHGMSQDSSALLKSTDPSPGPGTAGSPPLPTGFAGSPPVAGAPAEVPELIATQHGMEHLLEQLEQRMSPDDRRIALDLEADSLHNYREKICLIQIGRDDLFGLIDPLADIDLTPLLRWLDGCEIWTHGADYDMALLKRTFGHIPPRLLDTQIAARLAGARSFGLAATVLSWFDVELSKASQRADWSRRPLPDKMLLYAIDDIRYLLPLSERLLTRLAELGRVDWFHQSCNWARESVLKRPERDPDDIWRINGAGRLDRKGLALLRALWAWRDSEACRKDKPPFKVLNNEQLLGIVDAAANSRHVHLPKRWPGARRHALMKVITDALALPEEQWPRRRRGGPRATPPEGHEELLSALLQRRNELEERLAIDRSLIASRAVLEDIVIGGADPASRLMNWQLKLMFPDLAGDAAPDQSAATGE